MKRWTETPSLPPVESQVRYFTVFIIYRVNFIAREWQRLQSFAVLRDRYFLARSF